MKGQAKQETGFRFGQHKLTVLDEFGHVGLNGRRYKLVKVKTHDDLQYFSIRLYNAQGKFIKQMLFEPSLISELAELLASVPGS